MAAVSGWGVRVCALGDSCFQWACRMSTWDGGDFLSSYGNRRELERVVTVVPCSWSTPHAGGVVAS